MKPVLPKVGNKLSAAVAFVNRRTDGIARNISAVLKNIGLDLSTGYSVQELFDGKNLGTYRPNDTLQVKVNPTGRKWTMQNQVVHLIRVPPKRII